MIGGGNLNKKVIYTIIGLFLIIGTVSASILIYKQKSSPEREPAASSSQTTSFGSDWSLKSDPSSDPVPSSGSQPSVQGSRTTLASSSNFRGSTPNSNKQKSSTSQKSSALEAKDSTPKSQKVAYLTFDDGPSKLTPKILDVLNAKNVKATFFVIGKDDSQSNTMLKRMVREGHTIGAHSWSHRYQVIYSSETGFLNDFNKLRTHIYKVTGVRPNICRFPGGLNNTVCLKYGGHIMPKIYKDVAAMGIKPFDWNVAAHDACKTSPAKELILQNILSGCAKHPNAVILLHDTNLTTTSLQALPKIIDNLSARGYIFKALSTSAPSVLFKPT